MENPNLVRILSLFWRSVFRCGKIRIFFFSLTALTLSLLASSISASVISQREELKAEYEFPESYPDSPDYPFITHPEENSDSLAFDLENLSKAFANEKKELQTSNDRSPNFEGAIDYEYFAVMLPHVTSPYDLLRIQFGHWLSDQEISDYLSSLLDATNSANSGIWPGDIDSRRNERAQTTWSDLDGMNRALDGPYERLHYLRKDGVCSEPRRKFFRVAHFYPDPKVIFVPSEVLLHRCDLHSGCCENINFTCVPAEKKIIRQTFYKVDLLPRSTEFAEQQVRIDPLQILAKLQFVNHTRCQCKESVLAVPPPTGPTHIQNKNFIGTRACAPCPEPFSLRYTNSTCFCDCFDGETDCIHIKRGRKQLDGNEIKCIQNRKCHLPTCELGKFDQQAGFCPKSLKGQKNRRSQPKKHRNLTK